jgi:hypothetical protein
MFVRFQKKRDFIRETREHDGDGPRSPSVGVLNIDFNSYAQS